MRTFEILFDDAEPSAFDDPAYEHYGKLGFPAAPANRPWIYSNFVQSLDGIASFKGLHATGGDISQCPEDAWLMNLLRAHSDAVLLGVNTLIEETQLAGNRGPVYAIQDPELRELRKQLRRGREKNIFVTASGYVDPNEHRVFDPDTPVDTFIITTVAGAARLAQKKPPAHVKIVLAGEEAFVDLKHAMQILRHEHGIERLLCEGGPTLYGYMSRAGLVDEKFITISPVEIGLLIPADQDPSEPERRNPPRQRPTTFMAPGFTKENAPWWQWMSCRRIANHQFNRYRRRRAE